MLAGAAVVKPESCFLLEPAAVTAGLACAEAFALAGWAKRNSSATISVANAGLPSLEIFRWVRYPCMPVICPRDYLSAPQRAALYHALTR